MQREIKFRVWDKEENKMHLVAALDWEYPYKKVITCNTPDTKLYFGFHKEKLDPILMQYTGLKDKNGKEIFEGDIVITSSYPNRPSAVQLVKGTWCCDGIGRVTENIYYCKDIEVIGNIWENPELLQKEESK